LSNARHETGFRRRDWDDHQPEVRSREGVGQGEQHHAHGTTSAKLHDWHRLQVFDVGIVHAFLFQMLSIHLLIIF